MGEGPLKQNIDIRAELLKFHDTYYSANQMKLAVIGRGTYCTIRYTTTHPLKNILGDLDTLQRLVEEKFSALKNNGREELMWEGHPFDQEHLQVKLQIVPVKNISRLLLKWAVPSMRSHYRKKPQKYVSHLLGHEGMHTCLCHDKQTSRF